MKKSGKIAIANCCPKEPTTSDAHMKIHTLMLFVLIFGAATAMIGCGDPTTPQSESTADVTTISSGPIGCDVLSSELIKQVGIDYQLVRNLALAGGKNLALMEKNNNVPKPETFRTFASGFARLDISTVEALPNFDKPEVSAPSIRELADKLEAALVQKDNLSHPAWAELADFSKRRQNRQQSSVNYYLNELGCK